MTELPERAALPDWDARSPAFLEAVAKAREALATHPEGRIILAMQAGDYAAPHRPGDVSLASRAPQGFARARRTKRGRRG